MQEHERSLERLQRIEDLEVRRNNRSPELVQFRDSSTSVLYRYEGQSINWETHKHAKPHNFHNCVVVTMSDKTRIAVGTGVMMLLPEFDSANGVFVSSGTPLKSIEIDQVAPNGLPLATVGQEWMWSAHGPIDSMMMRYKFYQPGHADIQVGSPSHTEAAMRLLQLEAGKMFDGYIVPNFATLQKPI